jgi:hypothetical protein
VSFNSWVYREPIAARRRTVGMSHRVRVLVVVLASLFAVGLLQGPAAAATTPKPPPHIDFGAVRSRPR